MRSTIALFAPGGLCNPLLQGSRTPWAGVRVGVSVFIDLLKKVKHDLTPKGTGRSPHNKNIPNFSEMVEGMTVVENNS